MEDENLRLIKKVSSGSFGKVYKAWDRELGEIVAVKVEKSEIAYSILGYEAKILKLMSDHRGFPTFYGYRKSGGKKYVIM
jgi:serine/threonine protein kinase